MNKLVINNNIINFNYYYKRVFDPIYKKDDITNFNIPKIINKYYIVKSIYILQQEVIEDYLEYLDDKLSSNEEYKKISNQLMHNFFENKSIIDLASFSYCLSRKNHLVIIIEIDFIFASIERLIEDAFDKFLSIQDINQIKKIYLQILNNYYNDNKEKNFTGLFLYTDFKLNELIIITFLKRILFSIFKNLNFIVYKNNLLLFCSNNKDKRDYVKKIRDKLLQYYIYFKNENYYNLYQEDIIFRNNLILENYSCILKDKTFEFLKWQMEQKIEQEIPLSASSEILLLEYITNKAFNIFKNNIKLKEAEYYKKIKYYYDILVKNGCHN